MSSSIEFFVPGSPAGQPRARAVRRGKHAGVYSKDTSASGTWREMLVIHARPHVPEAPLEGALMVNVSCWFPRPKNLPARLKGVISPKRWREGRVEWHLSKPDRDNLDKLILDTLTALGFWGDDCQVCEGSVTKWYAEEGKRPGALIQILELGPYELVF